ncbi:MAG TPA: S9 family peptidase [Thermomicrobiales bacterium]|nr:S9 family peptidase [Thermomicrobiales bacterium]
MASTANDTAPDTANEPLGYEEIADRLIPSEPRISPDGGRVAFTVGTRGKKGDHPERAIWLSRDGEPATRFSGGESHDHDIRWSPDGTRLLFLSNRKDKEKDGIYIAPVDGGEAQRLGELEGSLSSPEWSPDGSMIAVLRTDEDSEEEQKRKKEEKDDPIVFEEDAHNARLWLVDVASGKARCLTFGKRTVWSYAWTPDGTRLVFITTPLNTINAIFRKTQVWWMPASGGIATLVGEFMPIPGSPVVRTVDGQEVVALSASDHRDDPSASVWTIPLAGGRAVNLLPGYAGVVQELIADPASEDGLIVRIVEGTHGRMYKLSAAGGPLVPVTPGALGNHGTILSSPTVATDGRTTACVWSNSDTPEEVYKIDADGASTPLTSFGEAFKDRLAPGEVVTWTSSDGVEVEGILIRPRSYQEGRRYPLLVQIHGGPSWQWEDRANLNWHDWGQMLASRGYAVLLPNPRGSTGYGSDFEKLLQDDVGGGESRDLVTGAEAMVARGIADPDRLAIGGWSWGGYLTAWTITQTPMFKAAIMGAGLANLISDHGAGDIPEANTAFYPGHPYTHWDLYAERSPLRAVTNVKTPTLILHGDNDARVSPTQGLEYYRALQVLGVPVRFVRYPREGHGIQERNHQLDLMRRVVDWLAKYVPADAVV